MQTDDAIVRAQVLDGVWETFGVDRERGIWPENITLSSNEWGSDKATFDLRRDPSVGWTDLSAFTPIEVEVGGELVWSGRVQETPARDGDDPVINVQCEGWQYHLDDDAYAAAYVHSRVTDWRDLRTFPGAVLGAAAALAAGQVSNDDGVIQLAFPKDTVLANGSHVGIILDLGPYATAASISVDWENSSIDGAVFPFMRALTTPVMATGSDAGWTGVNSDAGMSGPNTTTADFGAPSRYIALFLKSTSAHTTAADVFFKLKGIRVFTSTAYRSGAASVLKASTVVNDAVSKATAHFTDTSRVATTAFDIPDLHFETEPRSPREVIEGVNAFHNYLTQVDVMRRLVFQPRPTAPLFEIGAAGGAAFEDSAMNAGQEVYNRVIVTGSGPDGTPMLVERYAVNVYPAPAPQQLNGRFEVNTTGWTPTQGAIVRDTSIFASGVASARLETTGLTSLDIRSPALAVIPGRQYVLSFDFRQQGTFQQGAAFMYNAAVGPSAPLSQQTLLDWNALNSLGSLGSFVPVRLSFTPGPGVTSVALDWTASQMSSAIIAGWIDNVTLLQSETAVDRRLFRRTKILPVESPLTKVVADQLGDTYLAAHKMQPLKGSVTTQPGGVRNVLGGAPVHPAHMLRETGQLLRLSHRIDPDTSGLGRDGTLASVSYTHDTREAKIEIDSDRRNFEALLARFALLSPA